MAKFRVYGSVNIDVDVEIDAETKEEALEKVYNLQFYTSPDYKSVFVDDNDIEGAKVSIEAADGGSFDIQDAEDISDEETDDAVEILLEMDEEEYKKAIENAAKNMKDIM